MLPAEAGAKLTDSWQVLPAARVPTEEDVAETCGHAAELVPFRKKLAGMLGLLPEDGIGKVSGALPMLATVTVWAVLVEPEFVVGKVKLGGVVVSSLRTVPDAGLEA